MPVRLPRWTQAARRLNFEVSRAEYFKVLAMKTAELFALSCELGALLSGAAEAALSSGRLSRDEAPSQRHGARRAIARNLINPQTSGLRRI